jgi:hypothetical protein
MDRDISNITRILSKKGYIINKVDDQYRVSVRHWQSQTWLLTSDISKLQIFAENAIRVNNRLGSNFWHPS